MPEAPKQLPPSSQTTDAVGSGSVTSPPSTVPTSPVATGTMTDMADALALSMVVMTAPSLPPPSPTAALTLGTVSSSEMPLAAQLKVIKKRRGAEMVSKEKASKGRKTTEGSMAVPSLKPISSSRISSDIPDLVLKPGETAVLQSPDEAGSQPDDEDPSKESSISRSESSDSDFKVLQRRVTRSAAAASPALLLFPKIRAQGYPRLP